MHQDVPARTIGSTDGSEPLSADPAPRRSGPHWRWVALVLLGLDVILVAVNSIVLVDALRPRQGSWPLVPFELAWIQLTAIVLGTVVAIPVLVLLRIGARRAGTTAGTVLVAGLLGALVFLAEGGRLHDGAAVALAGIIGRLDADAPAVLIAPVVEELLKLLVVFALALWLRPRGGVRQGIVVGAGVGLAINLLEAGLYVQLAYGNGVGAIYGTVIATRFALFGLGLHVATAALLGGATWSALSKSARVPRLLTLVAGFIVAVGVHAVWNLGASSIGTALILVLEPHPNFYASEPIGQHLIWIAMSALTTVMVGPLLIAVGIIWRRSGATLSPRANAAASLASPALDASP